MRMNRTLAYGLACLHYLGKQNPRKWNEVSDIAKRNNLPEAYANKVLQSLARAGFVESQKGKGYRLVRDLNDIDVWSLMEAFTYNHAPEPRRVTMIKLYETLEKRVNYWLKGLTVRDIIEMMKAEEERKRQEKMKDEGLPR